MAASRGELSGSCVLIGRLTVAFCLLAVFSVAPLPPAQAREFKLWPLIDYRHAAGGGTTLNLLGPLIHYESGPAGRTVLVRPLLSWRQSPGPQGNEFSLLYPLSMTRWDAEITTVRLLGLFSYATQTGIAKRPQRWQKRFTIFPFIFYRRSEAEGRSLSVLPLYADLSDFLGFKRIRMLAFPLYLSLEEPLITRSWALFPFLSWTGGATGRGWRIWPLYGWQEKGSSERSRYVLWPLYVRRELYPGRPEREEYSVLGLFYGRADTPRLHSRAYLGPLLTHSIDTEDETETWGFPWPLWLYQRRRDTGERLTLRLAPLYQDRRQGTMRSRFYLWPIYRTRTAESDDVSWSRRDFLLVFGRDSRETRFSSGRRRNLSTFFPIWRDSEKNGKRTISILALYDALVPQNETIGRLYAPLWQIYRSEQNQEQPLRWSLLWDLLSFDGVRLHYPVRFDWGEEPRGTARNTDLSKPNEHAR